MQSKRHIRNAQQLTEGWSETGLRAVSGSNTEGGALLPTGASPDSETFLRRRRNLLCGRSTRSVDYISPSSPAIAPRQLHREGQLLSVFYQMGLYTQVQV